jgi:hypothetical protein
MAGLRPGHPRLGSGTRRDLGLAAGSNPHYPLHPAIYQERAVARFHFDNRSRILIACTTKKKEKPPKGGTWRG